MRRWGRRAAAAWLMAMIAGCVTTETGVFTEKKDPKKALEYSVQAARSYVQQRNWDAAKRHLKTALELDPNNADVHETMAQVFWNTGEYELADEHFRRAVSLDGSQARLRNNYAAFLYQRERYADAERQLEKVVEDVLYEKRPAAYVNLGLARIKLKEYDSARNALERGLLMDRGNQQAVFALAEVYFQLGDFAKAQNYYENYRKQVQRQSPGSLWLGIRLADKFNDRNALASYALALKNLYPRSAEYLEYVSVYGNERTGQ